MIAFLYICIIWYSSSRMIRLSTTFTYSSLILRICILYWAMASCSASTSAQSIRLASLESVRYSGVQSTFFPPGCVTAVTLLSDMPIPEPLYDISWHMPPGAVRYSLRLIRKNHYFTVILPLLPHHRQALP